MTHSVEVPSLLPEVVVIGGLRTPFAKVGTAYKSLSALQLGELCVRCLLYTSPSPRDS